MLRDIFHKRYKEIYFHFPNYLGGAETIPEGIEAFFKQSVHIILYDLKPFLKKSDELFQKVFLSFTRELGVTNIGQGKTYQDICLNYLLEHYDIWKTSEDVSDFIKRRISLIELIFSMVEEELLLKNDNTSIDSFKNSVDELNQRLRNARLGFYYKNKSINTYNDKLSSENIYEPYWEILKEEKYQIIDKDIKTAFERNNSNHTDAAFYAMRALESCIKIISDELKVSTGNEKGASNYIDNLLSKKCRYIDLWEAEALKLLFKEIRNPLGHGPGNEDIIELKHYQIKSIIDMSLVWIKSLVIRL